MEQAEQEKNDQARPEIKSVPMTAARWFFERDCPWGSYFNTSCSSE
jgi:hypothetical protein